MIIQHFPLSEVSLLSSFPLGTQLITVPQTTMPPDGSWAESSFLIHTVVMMHRVCDGNVHRQSHVGQSAAWMIVIHLPYLSKQKKSFFVKCCKPVIGQPTYANWWWCQLVSWLVVVQGSWWWCWSLNVHIHLPWAPHWVPIFSCCRCYLSLVEERLVHWAHSSGGQRTPRLSAWC